ncbi:hypothetical protein OFC58_32245, partial [Escherichia coli]|nr:hypothetical protein [Escherichia coli]
YSQFSRYDLVCHDLLIDLLSAFEQLLYLLIKPQTIVGQIKLARSSLNKLHRQYLFKLFKLPTYMRIRTIQALCRPAILRSSHKAT